MKKGIKNKMQWVFYVSMVAIPLLHFILFYVYVNLNSILLAFKTYDASISDFVWNKGGEMFDNFKTVIKMFSDPSYAPTDFSVAMGNSFRHSVLIQVLGWVIRSPLAWAFSWYVYKQKFGANAFRVILYLPQIISSVTMVTMFVPVMDLVVPNMLSELFGTDVTSFFSYEKEFGTYLFYYIWASFGGSVLIYSGTMSSISDSIIEAGQVDGVTPIQEFLKIVLPMIWPTIATFLVVGCADMFTDQMNLFTFNRTDTEAEFSTVGYFLYRQMVQGNPTSRFPILSAMGLCLTVIAMPVVLLMRWFTSKVNPMEN